MSSRDAFLMYSFKFILVVFVLNILVSVNGDNRKVAGSDSDLYIVYMGGHPGNTPVAHEDAVDGYVDLLSNVKGGAVIARNSIVHSYTIVFKAFAARLSAEEAAKLASTEGVLSVYPNRYHKLHTTKSWDFLGFPQEVRRNQVHESDVIIGLLDTGISPTLESFNGTGFGPPPAKWKGSCRKYDKFAGCNNKIIGARYFKFDGPDPGDILSPVDVNGHGTHTSSTAAGNVVANANLFGLGKGTARGAVPSARIAMYKVCWESFGCSDVDLLAAFEAAIHDGVDVISISIGGAGPTSYANDTIAIGSFHAMKHGILTVASAGNSGPDAGTVENHAPWMLTVGASGIDRQYMSKISFGNGRSLYGVGINTFAPKQRLYPLVSGANAGLNNSDGMISSSRYCMDGSLDPHKVKGKLVYCELQGGTADMVVKKVGAAGAILMTEMFLDAAQILMVPGTVVNSSVGGKIEKYIRKTSSATAVIGKSEEVKIPAPFIASFSSRGPSKGSNKILKPDIAAPGLDILAAYTPLNSLTGMKDDSRHSKFSIMSGTSMACPHTAGTAAYVKSFHPKWSPAAIRSAIITTATTMKPKSEYDSAFAYGAGQINPRRAVNPGLIYDMDALNYVQFLCHEGYNESSLRVLMQSPINCSAMSYPGVDAINYPSMLLHMDIGVAKSSSFRRTVTNVGPAHSVYNVTIQHPRGVAISVSPKTLSFDKVGQKRSFTVSVKAAAMNNTDVLSGAIVWRSGKYIVRSPIAVYTANTFQ